VDAAGIIFYPRLFEYCHDLLVKFFAVSGEPLPALLRAPRFLSPVRHAEVDYFRPLRFGDTIDVALVRAHCEASEVTLGFRIARQAEICAVAQSVHTFVDPASFQRIEIPEPMRSAFIALAGAASS
jgi:YbgC/YbaW family acyl-CoA thioester hydrolase